MTFNRAKKECAIQRAKIYRVNFPDLKNRLENCTKNGHNYWKNPL